MASDGQPQVDALQLVSGKYGKTFSAYRYQAKGDAFSRLYEPDGILLEKHLVAAPIDTYEQVTSLLRDGRHHKGVDFKTPVGSKVRATFAGTITRKNWNWHGNGNCLEVTESASPHRHALYLHLSPIPASVHVGLKVARGQVIAESGNTGHSFAPHLHYQLMAANGTKVLDPFESQATRRVAIAADQKAALEKAIVQLSGRMAPAVAAAGAK
jgi:murein DD-endopeptidase MepM/ murein hydrolase activator NlpD